MRQYKTAKHPKTGKVHVIGYVGSGQWMEISGPHQSLGEAKRACLGYERAERSQRAELLDESILPERQLD
jgi:hypothetical protein